MENSNFYDSIKTIAEHKNTIALINIKEFRRLTRIKGEYKWLPFKIDNLPALPIITSNLKEQFRSTKEQVTLRITPVWNFLTNGEQVITPNIERFELTEHSHSKPRYTLVRRIVFNRHYLSNSNWYDLNDYIIQRENAVEWAKKSNATLLTPIDDETLQAYIEHYQDELQEFDKLYEESVQKVLEIRNYQKKLK